MGYDCGFDIFPRLEPTAANKETYRRFLREVIRTFEKEYNDDGRREDGKILELPTDADARSKTCISFMVGECPQIPYNPDHCNYFLRFSSKISGHTTAPSEPYILKVLLMAKRYFGARVHYWHELNETGDEQQHGCYDWDQVRAAEEQLGALQQQNAHNSREPLSSDRATGEGSTWAIQPLPGKGQGMVATRKILQGTRILSEAPLFEVPRRCINSNQIANTMIATSLKGLDKDQVRAFLTLHNAHGTEYGPFMGIVKTNALPLGCDAQKGGLFIQAARINHACLPNAQNTWNEDLGRLTIHALRDIAEGEEITIMYVDRTMERAARQKHLKTFFCFDCRCELCMLPPAERVASDRRLVQMSSIDDALGRPNTYGYDEGLRLVRTMLRIFKEEGIWDVGVPRVYYDAFQIAASYGDGERAKVFATRAYAARVIIEGEDSPETKRLKRYAGQPDLHPAYGVYKTSAKSSKSTKPPPEKDSAQFDAWLWREK